MEQTHKFKEEKKRKIDIFKHKKTRFLLSSLQQEQENLTNTNSKKASCWEFLRKMSKTVRASEPLLSGEVLLQIFKFCSYES